MYDMIDEMYINIARNIPSIGQRSSKGDCGWYVAIKIRGLGCWYKPPHGSEGVYVYNCVRRDDQAFIIETAPL
jgi:hypothetical protein